MIVYDKKTGVICSVIQDDQDPDIYFKHYDKEIRNNFGYLDAKIDKKDYFKYLVRDNKLIELEKDKSLELKKYRRFLCEEERLRNKLMPSQEEIEKAKQTIEILTLISEVYGQ